MDDSTIAMATSRLVVASQHNTKELVALFYEDSDYSGVNPNLMRELALRERDVRNAWAEFKRVVQEWSRYIPPWRQLYPELAAGNLDCIMDLMRLEQKPLSDRLNSCNEDNSWVFSFLPFTGTSAKSIRITMLD